MSNDKYDTETIKVLSEAEALEAMFQSSGWSIAERSLMELIADLQNVSTLDTSSPDLGQEVRDRINTVASLQQWLSDLKGRVNNAIIMKSEPSSDKLVTRR